jgi:hypothetical protein
MLPVEDEAHEYERIWKLAFRGGWRFPSREAVRTLVGGSLWRARQGVPALAALNRGLGSGRPRVVVKTVLGVNSVEWIARRHNPAVVLVRRKVLSVVASWKNLGWTVTEIPGVHGRPTLEELLQRFPFLRDCLPMPTAGTAGACAWWTAAHHAIQDSVLDRNPGWLLADHDDLCVDPVDGFHGLLAGLGLPSSSAVEAFVVASNGEAGGPYVTRRLTAEQPQTWRQILTPAEVADVSAVADAFPARHLTSSKLTG